jgi:anti-sigma factor RsiW
MFAGLIEKARFMRDHRWAQRRMSEYLDGELDRADRERAARHMSECPECDELLASLRAIAATLAGVGGEPSRQVAAEVFSGVRRRLGARAIDDGSA